MKTPRQLFKHSEAGILKTVEVKRLFEYDKYTHTIIIFEGSKQYELRNVAPCDIERFIEDTGREGVDYTVELDGSGEYSKFITGDIENYAPVYALIFQDAWVDVTNGY